MTTDTGTVAAASRPVRVLHVIEATLGGTLRYLENIAAAEHEGMELGLAYGSSRARTPDSSPCWIRCKRAGGRPTTWTCDAKSSPCEI